MTRLTYITEAERARLLFALTRTQILENEVVCDRVENMARNEPLERILLKARAEELRALNEILESRPRGPR